MDTQDKERLLSIAEFLESGYCGDHQQRIQAGAAIRELVAAETRAEAALAGMRGIVTTKMLQQSNERVTIKVDPAVVEELRAFLVAQAPSGEGYSEFIAKAIVWRRQMELE